MMVSLHKLREQHPFFILRFIFFPFCYAVLILALAFKLGVTTHLEAEKYISAAKEFLSGNYHSLPAKLFYSSYIIFLTICFKLGLTGSVIVIIQALFQIIASWLLFQTGERIFLNRKAALLLTALYLFNLPIQTWTTTLYTESFFSFLVVCYLFFLTARPALKSRVLIIVFGLLLTFCRPTGILIAISGIVLLKGQRAEQHSTLLRIVVIGLLIAVFIGYFIMPVDPVTIQCVMTGSIIGGFAQWQLVNISETPVNLFQAYRLVLSQINPGDIIYVITSRLISFFNLTKPYFSAIHNIAVAPLFLLYPLALLGIFKKKFFDHNWLFFLSVSVFSITVLISLTFDEWTGRYFVPIMILILFPAAPVLNDIFGRSRLKEGRENSM